MKKLNIVWTFILFVLMYSCTEQPIGQYPVDKIAPQKVANPIVQNIKGGSTITYDLPSEADLLFVKAVYTLPNGKQKIVQTSAFTNTIVINGFAKSAKATVQLVSVDKSKNESQPVNVEVEPLDSPIFDVFASLKVIASFGGIKATWVNPEKAEIVIGVLYKNAENKYESLENFYTSVADGKGAVRGLKPIPTDFAVFVRDIYDNYTDTLFTNLTPYEELILDKKLWKALPLCSSYVLSPYGSGVTSMWDNVIGSAFYYLNMGSGVTSPIFFTLDLGVNAKYSRFKFWGRNDWYFNLHHPKEFEIWGTSDPVVANGDPCSFTGWKLLTTGISTKPSGPGVLANDKLTSEDKALAAAGEEFEFPSDAPNARYIRFRTMRTWTDSKSSFISELTFWGSLVK